MTLYHFMISFLVWFKSGSFVSIVSSFKMDWCSASGEGILQTCGGYIVATAGGGSSAVVGGFNAVVGGRGEGSD